MIVEERAALLNKARLNELKVPDPHREVACTIACSRSRSEQTSAGR